MKVRRLTTAQENFDAELKQLLAFETAQDDRIEQVVADILRDVKKRGDAAVLEYTERFDRLPAAGLGELELGKAELQAALASLPEAQRQAREWLAQG